MNLLIDRIAGLMETYVVTERGIKSLYKGDNGYIPEACLPAIIISPEEEDIDLDDNVHEQAKMRFAVSVVMDARKFFNAAADKPAGFYELIKIMREMGETGLRPDTILSVIRSKLFADPEYCQQVTNTRIAYGFGTTRKYPTIEAILTFTVSGKPYIRKPS